MLQNARIDCFHFVEHLDLVVRVRYNHCDSEDADQEEKKQDHEYQVHDEERGSLAAFLVQVQQVKLLVSDVLPVGEPAEEVLLALLVFESL